MSCMCTIAPTRNGWIKAASYSRTFTGCYNLVDDI
jgi:hypothetical protein